MKMRTRTKFIDLPDEEKCSIMLGIMKNPEDYECFNFLKGVWETKKTRLLEGNLCYRLRKNTDEINWSHVNKKWNYMARTYNNFLIFSKNRPEKINTTWRIPDREYLYLTKEVFTSYKQGNVPWEDSLVKRPEGVDMDMTREDYEDMLAQVPESVVETVELAGQESKTVKGLWEFDTMTASSPYEADYSISFQTFDGEPDPTTITMKRL